MEKYYKVCPECQTILGFSIDTLAHITENDIDDDTNLVEALVCPNCHYWEIA